MRRVLAAAVFAAFFGLYAFAAAPGLSAFRDAGDFAAAARSLGLPHPPGYPLYILLSRAVSSALPFGHTTYRLNLFSALCGAGAAAFVFLLLRRFGGLAAALSGALMAGLWGPAFSQAGMSEVYALNLFLAVGLLWGAFRAEDLSAPARDRAWVLLFFLWGLGLGNHQTLVLLAPAFFVFFRRGRVAGRLSAHTVAACLAALAAGLTVYAVLPLRAHADYVWGEPGTWDGFWRVLTRADYGSGTLSTRHSEASWAEALSVWVREWRREGGAAGMPLALAALVWGLAPGNLSSWGAPILLLWVCAGPVFALAARLNGGELSRAILEPVLVLPGVLAAAASGLLLGRIFRRGKAAALLAGAALLVWSIMTGAPSLLARVHRRDFTAEDYGRNLTRTVPPGAALLMISDPAVFAVSALQARGGREDLRLLVDAPLAWRWRLYRRRFPELFTPGQPDGGAALVRFQAGRTPVFTEGFHPDLIDLLCPAGMAARAAGMGGANCADELEAAGRFWDFYVRRLPAPRILARDYYDRATLKAVSAGAYNAGVLLAQAGRTEAARRFYAVALFWNPERILRWSQTF